MDNESSHDKQEYMFDNNKSILINTSLLNYTLKKKSNLVVYHFFWDHCAHNEWYVTYVNTKDNISDVKPLYIDKH